MLTQIAACDSIAVMRHTQVTKHVTTPWRLATVPVRIELPIGWDGIDDQDCWRIVQDQDDLRFVSAPLSEEQIAAAHETFEAKQRCNELTVKYVDGRTYLEEFLAIRTPEQAVTFLNKFGDPGFEQYLAFDVNAPLRFAGIIRFQKLLIEAATTPLSEWKSLRPPQPPGVVLHTPHFDYLPPLACDVSVRYEGETVSAEFLSTYGYEICFAVLFFDKVAGVEFRLCERLGCRRLFRVESHHNRKYCSADCAHVAAVRAWRARQEAPRSKAAKTGKGNQRDLRRRKKGRA